MLLFSQCLLAADLPSYCAYYLDLDKPNVEQPNVEQEAQQHFEYCLKGKVEHYQLKEIVELVRDTHPVTLEQASKEFQRHLAEVAVRKIIEKRLSYHGLFEDFQYHPGEKLMACAKEAEDPQGKQYRPKIAQSIRQLQKESRVTFDKEKQRNYLKINMRKAIEAKNLFTQNRDYKQKMHKIDLKERSMGRRCLQISRRCRGKNEECLRKSKLCRSLKKHGAEIKRDELNKKLSHLHKAVELSPLLFSNKETGDFLDGLRAEDLSPSPFMLKILEKGPKGLTSEIEKDQKPDNELVQAMKKETMLELKRLDAAVLAICEKGGADLHHYPELVNLAMGEYLNQANHREELKGRVAVAQGSYCHLLKNRPAHKNKMSRATIGGLALLGIGGVLTLIPVIGTVSGTGLMIVGSSLMTAAGAGLGAVGYLEGRDQTVSLKQQVGLHSTALTDYQRLLETKSARDYTYYGTAIDVPLTFVDVMGIRHLRHGKHLIDNDLMSSSRVVKRKPSRRLNIKQRERLDKMKSKLGEKRIKELLRKYSGWRGRLLSDSDKVYLASLADLVEQKLKQKRPEIDGFELKYKTKNVVKSVVNKCGPYRKN